MDLIKVGKKGQVSIPQGIMRRLAIEAGGTLLVETTADGALVLRPAGVYQLEIYDDARIAELEAANNDVPSATLRKARALLNKASRSPRASGAARRKARAA